MTFMDDIDGIDRTRVLGLDHSSKSLAFGLVVDGKPKMWGKLEYKDKTDNLGKYKMMPEMLGKILGATTPTYVYLEKSIVINSPATAVMLAEINGGLACSIVNMGYTMDWGPPITWQSYHGNIRVDKRREPFKSMTAKQKTDFKKSQTINKINARYPWINVTDDNVADAIAIGLFASNVSMKEVSNA